MSEQEVVEALIKSLERQNGDWRFFYGREVLSAEAMIERIQNDKGFKKTILTMVNNLSIDILLRQPK